MYTDSGYMYIFLSSSSFSSVYNFELGYFRKMKCGIQSCMFLSDMDNNSLKFLTYLSVSVNI